MISHQYQQLPSELPQNPTRDSKIQCNKIIKIGLAGMPVKIYHSITPCEEAPHMMSINDGIVHVICQHKKIDYKKIRKEVRVKLQSRRNDQSN